MKTALVTGAAGFIGGHLCRVLLERGWRVQAAVRDQASTARLPAGAACAAIGDIAGTLDCSPALRGTDVVFHLAGKAHDTGGRLPPPEYFRVNVEGTRRLLKASREAGVRRFVFFGSVAAGLGSTPYGRSKQEAETEVLAASGGAMTGVCLRLPLVYGPGQKGNLQRLIRRIDRGLFPALAWAENRRSFVHVDNVVQAALLAAESPRAAGRTYVVTDAEPYSTAVVCRLIRRALGREEARWDIPRLVLRGLAAAGDALGRLRGRPVPFDSSAFEKLCGDLVYTSEDISRELGYQPTADLPGAMAAVIEHAKRV